MNSIQELIELGGSKFELNYSVGIYLDSYNDPAITMGMSHEYYKQGDFRFIAGISVTKSLAGPQEIEFARRFKTIQPRFYAWPYLNFEYRHFYTQLRAGINEEKEPAGVFSFGLVFTLDELRNLKR